MTFHLSEAQAILGRTPRILDAWLRDLDACWLDCDEGAGTWNPRQVVAHLIHGEKTDWIPRVRHLLEHGEAVPFEPFDRTAHLAAAEGRSMAELLDEFARLRAENLEALRQIAAAGLPLERRGTHPELGSVTLRQLLATWTAHDLGHLVQIARTMARRYTDEVGPWAQYLGVIGKR